MEQKSDGKVLMIIGLILGIASIVCSFIYMVNIGALIGGIAGIVLAVIGRKQASEAGAPTGMGTAALVLSIIGTILSVIGVLTCTVCTTCFANALEDALDSGALQELQDAINQALETAVQ